MKLKKLLSLTLALLMAFSISITAMAAETNDITDPNAASGTVTGSGDAYTYETDVFHVTVPVTEGSTIFDFVADPQNILERVDESQIAEAGSLYFKNSENKYTTSSEQLTVTNKSTFAVDISVAATVSGLTGITLSDDDAFTGSTATSIYLALVDDASAEEAITADGGEITAEMAAAPEAAYYIAGNDTDGYALKPVDDPTVYSVTFDTYTFGLIGASNTAADWTDLDTANLNPTVSVTWEITKGAAAAGDQAPSVSTEDTLDGNAITIDIDWGTGDLAATEVTGLTFQVPNGSVVTPSASAWSWTEGSDVVTVSAANANYILNTLRATSVTYTIIFDEGEATVTVEA